MHARSILALLVALPLFASCGRDFQVPTPIEAETDPSELGPLAGLYELWVYRDVTIDGRTVKRIVPVSGIAGIQHLVLPPAAKAAAGGNPMILAINPSVPKVTVEDEKLDIDTLFVGYGFSEGSTVRDGMFFATKSHGDTPWHFDIAPLPGSGLLKADVEACPGVPIFTTDAPLYLQRRCSFAASRSGVYSGCTGTCSDTCDPATQSPDTFIAAGFLPGHRQAYDLVSGLGYSLASQQGDRSIWTIAGTIGIYDRYLGSGVALLRNLQDPKHVAPSTFRLVDQGDTIALEMEIGKEMSAGGKYFTFSPDASTLADVQIGSTCYSRIRATLPAGPEDEACDAPSPPISMAISANQAWDRFGTFLKVDVWVQGLGHIRAQDDTQRSLLAQAVGLLRPTSATNTDLVVVQAFSGTSRTPLTRLAPARCRGLQGEIDGTACFKLPPRSKDIVIEAALRPKGTWEVCKEWPDVLHCAPGDTKEIHLDLPLVEALPTCFPRP